MVLEKFQNDFKGRKDLMASFHVQGMVSPGSSTIADPDLNALFKDINVPNYVKDLGKYPDTGGQTAHVFEQLFHAGKSMPTVMFTMSHDKDSTEPVVKIHGKGNAFNSYVVYLPYSLMKEAEIDASKDHQYTGKDGANNRMVLKETMVANRKVFDVMAEHAVQFLHDNVEGFDNKNVILSGHYIDGGQTVLDVQERLKQEGHKGSIVSMWNPHTLGIDKLQTLLNKHIDKLKTDFAERQDFFSWLDKDTFFNLPIIKEEKAILDAIGKGATPDQIAPMLREHLQDYAAKTEQLKNEYQKISAPYMEGPEVACPPSVSEFMKKTVLAQNSLKALIDEYSLDKRLEMESPENITKFDGIAATSQEMEKKLNGWLHNERPIKFIRNGFLTGIFDPDSLEGSKDGITNQAKKIIDAEGWGWKTESNVLQVSAPRKDKTDALPGIDITAEALKDKKVFVSVARADDRKGFDIAVHAFAKYLENGHDGLMVFPCPAPKVQSVSLEEKELKPGEEREPDPYTHILMKVIEEEDKAHPDLHIKDKIKLLDSVTNLPARVLYGLPNAIGFVSSGNEPWGIVAEEIMASGIPIVASDLYAAAKHHADKQKDGGRSVLLYRSQGHEGQDVGQSINEFADQMAEAANNYKTYKGNAVKYAGQVVGAGSWERMGDSYLDFAKGLELNRHTVPAGELGINAIILEDIDGCLTPNIHEKDRQAHPALTAVKEQIKQIQGAGGVSVLATGRSVAGINADPLMDGFPADYAITSVGVQIAKKMGDHFEPMQEYEDYLLAPDDKSKQPFNKHEFDALLKHVEGDDIELLPQKKSQDEIAGQRLGYFVSTQKVGSDDSAKARIRAFVKEKLGDDKDYQVLPSLDPHLNKWNVDIMPSKAGKKGATDWLIERLKQEKPLDSAIVWGDSGNDIPSMQPSTYLNHGLVPAFVAPANAMQDVRDHLLKLEQRDGFPVSVYTSEEDRGNPKLHNAGGIFSGLQAVLPKLKELVQAKVAVPSTRPEALQGKQIGGPEIKLA